MKSFEFDRLGVIGAYSAGDDVGSFLGNGSLSFVGDVGNVLGGSGEERG